MLNGGVTEPGEARTLTYAGLLSIARERGYGRGWIGHKYKAIYGVWPPDDAPEPVNPSPELTWWIKKQNVEYAKTRFPRENQGEQLSRIHASEARSEADETLMQDEDWDVDL